MAACDLPMVQFEEQVAEFWPYEICAYPTENEASSHPLRRDRRQTEDKTMCTVTRCVPKCTHHGRESASRYRGFVSGNNSRGVRPAAAPGRRYGLLFRSGRTVSPLAQRCGSKTIGRELTLGKRHFARA